MGVVGTAGVLFAQFRVLLWKNIFLQIRNWKSTFIQLLSPIIFVVILLGLQQLYVYEQNILEQDTPPQLIGSIPLCIKPISGDPCHTLLYAPNTDDQINEMMHRLAFANHPQLRVLVQEPHPPPPDQNTTLDGTWDYDVVGLPNDAQLANFVTNFPNRTLAGMLFYDMGDIFVFDVLFNGSTSSGLNQRIIVPDARAELIHSLNSVILQYFAEEEAVARGSKTPNISMIATSQKFPIVSPPYAGATVVSTAGAFFFFCPPMLNLIVLMNQIVTEKELKLRLGMRMMGLRNFVFWISWFITNSLINFLSTLLLIASGWIAGFDFFTNTNFLVNFLLFFTFGVSMIPFAFVFIAFIQRTITANTVGFVLFVLGLFFQILFTGFAVYFWYLPTTDSLWRNLFSIYPPFNFAKAFSDISQLSSAQIDPQSGQFVTGVGFGIADLFKSVHVQFFSIDSPPVYQSFLLMILDATIYVIIFWYFENILKGEHGAPRPFYFPFTLDYWGLGWLLRQRQRQKLLESIPLLSNNLGNNEQEKMDPEIRKEILKTIRLAMPDRRGTEQQPLTESLIETKEETSSEHNPPAISIIKLNKAYNWIPIPSSLPLIGPLVARFDFKALTDLYLTIDAKKGSGFCFTLLGANGAGKSTLVNTLIGLFKPTSGDAYIFGHSVTSDSDVIRQMIGVCPQHDILWNELTAAEHLHMFAEFKGIPRRQIKTMVNETLQMVGLFHVRNKRAGTFSGGMKRRLSVGISSIGNPRVIFMDEPTTGLDPLSRRKVWNLIEMLKKDKIIVLTTHLMDEADVLSDRIGIMAFSRLWCLGDSIALKSRFGFGYHLHITADLNRIEDIKQLVHEKIPNAQHLNTGGNDELAAASHGNLHFVVNSDQVDELGRFCHYIESLPHDTSDDATTEGNSVNSLGIRDWGLSNTTLEEVFHRVTQEARRAKQNQHGVLPLAAEPIPPFAFSPSSSSNSSQFDRQKSMGRRQGGSQTDSLFVDANIE